VIIVFPCIDEGFGKKTPVDVVIRPEDIIIDRPGNGIIDGVVTSNSFYRGFTMRCA
jgi:hypothetical protein